MSKYKYLEAIKFTIISKLLGYKGYQGIRITSVGHDKLFTMLNDAIGEVIEKFGCTDYKKFRGPDYKGRHDRWKVK